MFEVIKGCDLIIFLKDFSTKIVKEKNLKFLPSTTIFFKVKSWMKNSWIAAFKLLTLLTQRIAAGLSADSGARSKQKRVNCVRFRLTRHLKIFLLERLVGEEWCSRVGNDSKDSRDIAAIKRSRSILFGINRHEHFPYVSEIAITSDKREFMSSLIATWRWFPSLTCIHIYRWLPSAHGRDPAGT